ncbi:MAG: hypothetical protein V3W41_07675 [Planctomycetota bacterium]
MNENQAQEASAFSDCLEVALDQVGRAALGRNGVTASAFFVPASEHAVNGLQAAATTIASVATRCDVSTGLCAFRQGAIDVAIGLVVAVANEHGVNLRI